MRIAVVGAGAIGSWLAGALARAGHDVLLVARGAQQEAIARDGLRVVPADAAPYVARPSVVGDPRRERPADAVLLAVKAHDQPAAAPAARALLGEGTSVVSVQNGVPWWYFHGLGGARIDAVDPAGAVSAALPPERAIGMVVYLGAHLERPGLVHTRPENGLVIGEPSGEDTPRLRALAGALEQAGFPVRRSPAIRTDIWTKLMGNASLNPISVLTGAGLGTMVRHPGTRAVVATIMRECVDIARASGAAPTISIEERLAITARLGDHKTSMLQDFEAGKALELGAIVEAPLEMARMAGVAAPALEAVAALTALAATSSRPR